MAAPRADSYTAASGVTVAGGRYLLPPWREVMAPFTWAVVPVSASLATVDPEDNPALNPNHPAAAPWHGSGGQAAVLDAWCSLVPSQSDGRIWLPIGGGHGDYAGNEGYAIDLMAAAPAWSLVRRPSGALPDAALTYVDGQESAGVYADGRIRATHTYQGMVHVPGRGIFLSDNTASYYTATGNPRKAFWISETGDHSVACDYTALPLGGDHGACCHDTLRDVLWFTRANSLSRVAKFDPAGGVVTAHGVVDSWVGGGARMLYVAEHDLVLQFTGIGSGLVLWNPATEVWKRSVTLSGTRPAWLVGNLGDCGSAWLPALGAVLLWNNDSSTTSFAMLTPGANAHDDAWTWGQLDAAPGNAVVPPARPGGAGGTGNVLGKCDYLPALRGMYLQVTFGSPLHFFATE